MSDVSTTPRLRLDFAAISDVGRVRKDNQDSGYAGPWLLTVCDGVGGAARGDIASSTAVQQLRRLDAPPAGPHSPEDLLGLVSGALYRAHDRIGELVDADPSLGGTSTTATVALFDGERLAIGHVGDSRAYLLREGRLRQITHDHTFVQTLIDEGRITEEESRTHPHRNLILKALDGMRDVDPDLFTVDLQPGDRLMLCSDGVCGVLPDARMAEVLGDGTPDYAAVELVRESLDEGSTDNVTCIVADVLEAGAPPAAGTDEPGAASDGETVKVRTQPLGDTAETPVAKEPMLVGAAAELRRNKLLPEAVTGLFRHRSGDTGELEAVRDDDLPPDAIAADPEEVRYALKPPERHPVLRALLVTAVVIGVLWIAAAAAYSWSQQQWFVGEQDGRITIYRGINTTVLGYDLYDAHQSTDLELEDLPEAYQEQVSDGIPQPDLASAQQKVRDLADEAVPSADETTGTGGTEPSAEPSTGAPSPGAVTSPGGTP